MLRKLRIENFALIDEALLSFNNEFAVITGETGAGKSILLNALGLILGNRANYDIIGSNRNKSIVEAEIDISKFDTENFFEINDIDFADETIIRREILSSGKSRAFINDTPVSLSVLKSFSEKLIHIHSQYNTLELKGLSFQMKVIDVLSNCFDLSQEYNKGFESFKKKSLELKNLKLTQAEQLKISDFNKFQLNELIELNLENKKYDQLQQELDKSENSDTIKMSYESLIEVLSGDNSVIERLNGIKSTLNISSKYDENLSLLLERIDSLLIDAKDISDESESSLNNLELNVVDKESLFSDLDKFNSALLKHRVKSQDELIAIQADIVNSDFESLELDSKISLLESELVTEKNNLEVLADRLHQKRIKNSPIVAELIIDKLNSLKLSDTLVEFNFKQSEELGVYGFSDLEFLFSPNKGMKPTVVHKSASGGELSRLMLAIQSLISTKIKLQTVLFDEIDTGVSGDVASKMGETLKGMGQGMQVIAITHLPQVAAKGLQHFKVFKNTENDKTSTYVEELSETDRIAEIAGLMSAEKINDNAIEAAKVLINE